MAKPKSAGTETQFTSVTDADALKELVALSHSEPVILFKHSTTCPISAAAYQEMSNYGGQVSLVVVQKARDVSREIEQLTGVRHESPQAIIMREGKAVWSASHFSIRADDLKKAFGKYQ